MTEDPFLNLASDTSSEDAGARSVKHTLPSSSFKSRQVIERKIYTITTVRIYPNGEMFIAKSQSWIDKKKDVVKKKIKKKAKLKPSNLQTEEVY